MHTRARAHTRARIRTPPAEHGSSRHMPPTPQLQSSKIAIRATHRKRVFDPVHGILHQVLAQQLSSHLPPHNPTQPQHTRGPRSVGESAQHYSLNCVMPAGRHRWYKRINTTVLAMQCT